MNISSSAAVSTLVPQATAAGSGQSSSQNWANSDGAQAPQVKAESWAVSKESENWAGDKPAPEPASQRVDIKV